MPDIGSFDHRNTYLDAVLVIARADGMELDDLADRAGLPSEVIERAKLARTIEPAMLTLLAAAARVDLRVLARPRRSSGERSSLAEPRLKLAWSNPDAPVSALIANAIERRSFELILRAAWEHGIDAVGTVTQQLREQQALPDRSLDFAERALRNIAIGAARVQQQPCPAY